MTVEDVRKELGSDAELVKIEEVGEVIKVALKEYQRDRSIWRRINDNLKQLGGVWVSEGKLSRWQIPKEGAMSTATSDKKDLLVKDAIAYLEHAIEKLKEMQK